MSEVPPKKLNTFGGTSVFANTGCDLFFAPALSPKCLIATQANPEISPFLTIYF